MKTFLRNLFTLLLLTVSGVGWAQDATTYKLEKVKSVEAGGLYVFEQSGYVMTGTVTNSALQTTNSYKTSGLTGTEEYIWTLETSGSGFYFKNVSNSKYLANSDGTNVSLASSGSVWNFNFQTDETVLIQNSSNSYRFLGFTSATSYAYKAYSTSNISGNYPHAIAVYKLVDDDGSPSDPIDPSVSFASETFSLEVGETKTNAITKPGDLTVTFSSDNTSVATVDADGAVTGVAEGTATITASWTAVENTYNAGLVTYTVKVVPATIATTFYKVNDVKQLVAGNQFILVSEENGTAMGAVSSSNVNIRTSVGISLTSGNPNTIALKNEEVTLLTLGENEGYWTFLASDNNQYLTLNSSSNEIHSSETVTNNSLWIVSADFQVQDKNYSRYIRYNSSNPRFACYTSGQKTAYLYVKEGYTINDKEVASADISKTSLLVGSSTATITTDPSDLVVAYSTSDENIANVSADGVVTPVAAGTVTITAAWEEQTVGDKTYEAGNREFSVTVFAIEDGFFNFEAHFTDYGSELEPSDASDYITEPKTWTAGYVTLVTSGKYRWWSDATLRFYNNNPQSSVTISVPSGYVITTIEITGGQNFAADCGTYESGTWSGQSQTVVLSYAAQSGTVNVKTVKVTYERPAVEAPTFYPAGGDYTAAQTVTLSCATEGATIYYTLDGTDPTAESTAYTGPITIEETTTVKAIAIGTDDSQSTIVSSTYTIIDPTVPGTSYTPYTVAQARAAIDAGEGITGVYATGIVSEIVTAYNSQYGNITYNVSADGLTTSDQLQAYRGKSYNGENFTSEDDIQVGDVVVIFGNLKNYNGTYEFDANNQLVSLERDERPSPGLDYATKTFTANLGEEFTTPVLTNPNTLAVVYNSSEPTVATVDADGSVTILTVGSTTITATFAGDENYKPGTASYTLTVVDPNAPGTENNPYTVAQARAAIDAGEGITGVYVKGVVSEIVTAYNSEYGNISYNISADGLTTSDQLQAYRGKSYNGDDFTSEDDIQVADEVVVFGTLKKYNDIYEFEANNQLVSLVRKEKEDANLAFSPETATAKRGQEFTAPTLTFVDGFNGTVTYSSSDKNVATVDAETGAVTLVAAGTTTITATFAGNSDYNAGSASYELTVTVPSHNVTFSVNGTASEPVEVAEDAAIPFQEVEDVDDMTVIGWTTAAITGLVDDAPEVLVTSATMGIADVTYYAVFSYVEEGETATATLTEEEIKANFSASAMAYNDAPIAYNDESNVNWTFKGYTNKDVPWIQLRKNATPSYLYVSSPKTITELKFTITNSTVQTGESSSDISKHGTFAGSVILLGAAQGNATEGTLGASSQVDNNILSVVPTSNVSEVYVQVTSGARIWNVEVSYGTPATYSGYCTTVPLATKPGDVNKDGNITIADVTALVDIILGKDSTEPYQFDHEAANVNGDESVTIADVTKLVDIILGKE